jgi:hypothetical protein
VQRVAANAPTADGDAAGLLLELEAVVAAQRAAEAARASARAARKEAKAAEKQRIKDEKAANGEAEEEEEPAPFSMFSFVATGDSDDDGDSDGGGDAEEEAGTGTVPGRFCDRRGRLWCRSEKVLGNGAFGTVYLGMDGSGGELVAVKAMPVVLAHSDECFSVVREIALMVRIRCDHVVQYISAAVVGGHLLIVMEAIGGGSLISVVQQYPTLPRALVATYLRDTLLGLRWLHSNGIVHRDVKPHNILITLDGRCKLADFGTATFIGQAGEHELSGNITGTPVYMSPEACRGECHVRTDIWSLGIMACQMATGELPYCYADVQLSHGILHKLATRADYRPDTRAVPAWLRPFVERCLEPVADLRPSADELLVDALFSAS